MTRLLTATLCLLVLLLWAHEADASGLENRPPPDPQVVAWVHYYAAYYGADYSQLYNVGYCESFLQPYAVGDNGNSVGPFQFWTWGIWSSTPQARAGYSRYDPEANVAAAAWSFAHGYAPHWSCYRLIYWGYL